jgi:dihydrofolate synthase/folylpolyglutamate synthase
MKIRKILDRLLRLHPKEIDLSLDRIKRLNRELGNPQDKLKIISITGTNGKYSIAQSIRSILEEAGYICDLYTSPHIKKINERFVFSGKEIADNDLCNLLEEVEMINKDQIITFFEFLTSCFFLKASRSNSDITIVENGLFNRFDACSSIKHNLMSIISSIGLDHLEWLPKNDRNIDRIIFEKTSRLLHSKIIVSEQSNQAIINKIEKAIASNPSEKVLFNKDFFYSIKDGGFTFQDNLGTIKLPFPNLPGSYQISNVSTAIVAVRNLESYPIKDCHIKKGITKIKSIARLQTINKGKLKKLAQTNTLIVDGTSNPLGASVTKKYLDTLDKDKKIYIILGMLNNKQHKEYLEYFKDPKIQKIIAIDIPNQKNCIEKVELKKIIDEVGISSRTEDSIQNAISSLNKHDKKGIIFITGSQYLSGDVLNLNH